MKTLLKENLNYQIFNDVQSGYLAAKLCTEDMIFIGGSNFVLEIF
jgi:dihydrofolate synthase/folylpolyglutamate synthase